METDQLKQEIYQLKQDFYQLIQDFYQLNLENNQLKQRLFDIESKKNESYYQKFLEKYFNATHKKTKFGITDISTNNQHIEIKHWCNYKAALGQLLSYNFNDNKSLAAYFYGSVKEEQKQNIIELFTSKNVSVYEFVDGLDGIKINTLYDANIIEEVCESNEQKFEKWICDKILFCEDSYMNLEEICSTFLGKLNIHSSIKLKYKIIVENFIKNNIKNVKGNYGVVNINGRTYKGWKNLMFYNKKDSFIKWLDENVEYKENSILQVKDVCEKYLGKEDIHSSISSKYRKKMEKYIQLNYSNIKWDFGMVKCNEKTFKGWKHLCIKNN
jgi:regulator of replication initiation timing